MNEIKIKKSTLYVAGIILIILAGSVFMIKAGKIDTTESIIDSSLNGDVQNIVLGMKNFNYYPNTITVKAGIPVSISLDDSVYGCFRDFTIPEFGIHEYLRTSQDTVEFLPTKSGKYTFACSMRMGVGTLIVE